jgi:hypothetical protein
MRWKVIIAAALWMLVAVEVGSFLNRLRLEGDGGISVQAPVPAKLIPPASQKTAPPLPPSHPAQLRTTTPQAAETPVAPQLPSRPAQISKKADDWNFSATVNPRPSPLRGFCISIFIFPITPIICSPPRAQL